MERQGWFKHEVDTRFMVEHFGTHNFPINAKLMKGAYPMIAEEYGDDQELTLEIDFRMPRVHFGTTERPYPMIAEEYGDDQELTLEIDFRMPRVHFGTTE